MLLSCSLVVKVVSIEMKGLGFESHWVELFPTSQILNGFKSSPSVNEKGCCYLCKNAFCVLPFTKYLYHHSQNCKPRVEKCITMTDGHILVPNENMIPHR